MLDISVMKWHKLPELCDYKVACTLWVVSAQNRLLTVSPASMWPPGGTQTLGKVLICLALLTISNFPSAEWSSATEPTSIPLFNVSVGSCSVILGVKFVIGQKHGLCHKKCKIN